MIYGLLKIKTLKKPENDDENENENDEENLQSKDAIFSE